MTLLSARGDAPADPAPEGLAPPAPSPVDEIDLARRLASLDLETKVRLLTGATAWRLFPAEAAALRSMVVSDGPAGVRGTGEVPGETSLSFPSPSAVAATWDVGLAARLGRLFAAEARAHHADVVLAPVVNLQRTPVGGRHYECFSEDPLLTAHIAGAVVESMQADGVAACVKHFVGNESETQRTEYVVRMDDRTLREVYLAPFEHVLLTSGAWTVMAAYNGLDLDGEVATATEHRGLLTGILKGEWGYDGVVISDWLAARSTAPSAVAGLDLVMPGPGGPWAAGRLLAAVRDGEVAESVVDDKVLRLLRLAARVGALDVADDRPDTGSDAVPPRGVDDGGLVRELAARATVVVRDASAQLPLTVPAGGRVALIGPNAVDAFIQGGGSAHVTPLHVVSPAEGLAAALAAAGHADAGGAGPELVVRRGGYARRHAPDLDIDAVVTDPLTGRPGLRVELLDAAGEPVRSWRHTGEWPGWVRDEHDVAGVRLTGHVQLAEAGAHWLGVGTVGACRIVIDGHVVAESSEQVGAEVVLDSSVNSPDDRGAVVAVDAPRAVRLEATLQNVVTDGYGSFARAALRHRPPGASVDEEIAEAVAAAAAADVVVVVVGTNDEVESEGWDRTGLALPGRQDELVARVLEVAPDAVVVVNAGAPLVLPWLDDARTVLWTWFPGQECGAALADVLLGRTEPSGRLPWTLPAREEDVPVPSVVPGEDLVVEVGEGLHVGYRSWERLGRTPAAPFGHGLGWTVWEHEALAVDDAPDGGLTLTVRIRNTGPRVGHEVVQAYLEGPDDGPERPVRWLAGFATAQVAPGEAKDVAIAVPRRALEIWDVDRRTWVVPPGAYRVRVGRSLGDLRLEEEVTR